MSFAPPASRRRGGEDVFMKPTTSEVGLVTRADNVEKCVSVHVRVGEPQRRADTE